MLWHFFFVIQLWVWCHYFFILLFNTHSLGIISCAVFRNYCILHFFENKYFAPAECVTNVPGCIIFAWLLRTSFSYSIPLRVNRLFVNTSEADIIKCLLYILSRHFPFCVLFCYFTILCLERAPFTNKGTTLFSRIKVAVKHRSEGEEDVAKCSWRKPYRYNDQCSAFQMTEQEKHQVGKWSIWFHENFTTLNSLPGPLACFSWPKYWAHLRQQERELYCPLGHLWGALQFHQNILLNWKIKTNTRR